MVCYPVNLSQGFQRSEGFELFPKKHPPHRNNIQRWCKRIDNTVSVKNRPDQELQALVILSEKIAMM